MANLQSLSNPLATIEQLQTSASQLDGLSSELEQRLRWLAAALTQAAGVLLHLPQDVVARAIVVLTRFYLGPEGGSYVLHSIKDLSAAAIYVTAKTSFTPLSPRSVLNVYAFLASPSSPFAQGRVSSLESVKPPAPASYTLTEGQYQAQQILLYQNEALLLRTIGYSTHVALPHPLALIYLQTLGLLAPTTEADQNKPASSVAARVLAYLNTALMSPQLLYVTHQPHALAVAAIYRAARDEGCKLAAGEWWRALDVDREELGFLAVALGSVAGFVEEKVQGRWQAHRAPLTAEEVQRESAHNSSLSED